MAGDQRASFVHDQHFFRLAGRESLHLVRKLDRPFVYCHDKGTDRSLKDDIELPEDGYPSDEQTESES